MIKHIRSAKFPQLRFEYHPETKRVYFIRVGVAPEVGEVVAENVDSEGAAQVAVLVWLRGYREGSTPTIGARSAAH